MNSNLKKQIVTMLELQASNNVLVHPEWRTQKFQFLRAALLECCECIEHIGWKWWKKQTPDIQQAKLEMVDIWHFLLSHAIASNDLNKNTEEIADSIVLNLWSNNNFVSFDGKKIDFLELTLLEKLELFSAMCAVRRVSFELFNSIILDLGMNWDELYTIYIGKNALNIFRQDNGYAKGTYMKTWNGEEDNVHLFRIIEKNKNSDDLFVDVLRDLKILYTKFN
jgi:dimeric dUTPase (all-alpha-NTP-PPase superfamily)